MTINREVLRKIIETAGLSLGACAASVGISETVFSEMLSGQRDLPDSLVPITAAVLGFNESVLSSGVAAARKSDVVPAIWYKLRSDRLTEVDREYVLAVRQLAFHQYELEQVTDSATVGWKSLFETLRRETDPQASPTEQGRQAARLFRRSTGLDQTASGVGEVFRGNLRNHGILIIESSAPDSVLEGCSFYAGPSGIERPALFANSYRTTWFRRNRILMHELAHAVFDVESAIATLDFIENHDSTDIHEQRADAFAQEALVPAEVLRNVAQRNHIRLDSLDAEGLAALIACTYVEQRLLAKALFEGGFVDQELATKLATLDIARELKLASTHALTTVEYVNSENVDGGVGRRTTTTAPRKLMLPARYVGAVLDAIKEKLISQGKASKMLMIDEFEFTERFPTEYLAFSE